MLSLLEPSVDDDGPHSLKDGERLVAIDPGKRRLLTQVVHTETAERCLFNTKKTSETDRFDTGFMSSKEWSYLCGHKYRKKETDKKINRQAEIQLLHVNVTSAAVPSSMMLLHRY